jgi:hypothetical protein
MDKNRIEGRHGASRWHNTPKASSGMPVEVNAAAVQQSNVQLPGEWERSGHRQPQTARRVSEANQISRVSAREKSAEAIVIGETSRSAREHSKIAGRIALVPRAMQSVVMVCGRCRAMAFTR